MKRLGAAKAQQLFFGLFFAGARAPPFKTLLLPPGKKIGEGKDKGDPRRAFALVPEQGHIADKTRGRTYKA